jgi:hypothetical protein
MNNKYYIMAGFVGMCLWIIIFLFSLRNVDTSKLNTALFIGTFTYVLILHVAILGRLQKDDDDE